MKNNKSNDERPPYSTDEKAYLELYKAKIDTIIERGFNVLEKIPGMVAETQHEKHDWTEEVNAAEKIQKRRFGAVQTAKMVGVDHKTIYEAEKTGRLPPPEFRKDTKRKYRSGYTVNQINHMQRVFNTAPRKPEGLAAAIAGIMNLKGGCHKTTTTLLFSQNLAMKGYRVLLLDTDPQASLSLAYGKRPDENVFYENTIAPFMLEDDECLVENGFEEGASQTLHYAIQKTYWDNVDIIPACLQNLSIDLLMNGIMDGLDMSPSERMMKLRNGLLGVSGEYDFILIDGTPSLNISTLNVFSACDVVLTPTPAAMMDFASTIQFCQLIGETLDTFMDGEEYPNIPDVRYFITKYSGSSYAKFMASVIRKVFSVENDDVLKNESHVSDEIGKASNSTYTIYEQNPSEADNRERLKSTIAMFDTLFDEMESVIWDTCFDETERSGFISKIDKIINNSENTFAKDLSKSE